MTSRAGTLIAQPSWVRALDPEPESPSLASALDGHRVRWGIRASARADLAGGVAILAATAGLWIAFLLAVW
jgi:hypothetical protein